MINLSPELKEKRIKIKVETLGWDIEMEESYLHSYLNDEISGEFNKEEEIKRHTLNIEKYTKERNKLKTEHAELFI